MCPLQFDLQQAHIYCDPEFVLEEGCCEILPGGVSGLDPRNRWTCRFEVGLGQAAKDRMHFWEWKQHVSRGAYTQRIHKDRSTTTSPGAAGAWKAAENLHSGAGNSQAIELRSQDKAGSTALKCRGLA